MKTEPFIDIKNLVKIYKGQNSPALDDLSLQIDEGEIFGILGPNGAGKTTIISILCNIIPATSGNVTINNLSLHKDKNEIKRLSGVVFQDIALYDKLSARENLMYFGTLYGISRKDLLERIPELLNRMGLENAGDKKIAAFSGGMKRRINLLIGLLHKPRLLFLDEPAVGIDVHSRNVIIDFLTELNHEGMTMIYTSHLMHEAEKLCTRVSIIDYGKLLTVASPKELIRNTPGCDSLEDVFLKITGRSLRD